MGIPSAGGALLPFQDQRFKGNVIIDGSLTVTGQTLSGGVGSGAGAAATAAVTAAESQTGIYHQTTLTLTNLAVALSDLHVGGGTKIYTFPKGNITVLGALASVAETTTSTLSSTLNTGVTLSAGVGSVQTTTQDSGTLATTQQDIVNAFAVTASATINVAGAVAKGSMTATTTLRYDGTSTATAVFLNCGVPTATDIDGDATTTWSGTITISWTFNGTA